MFTKCWKFLFVILVFGLVFSSGCAPMQTLLSEADNGKQVSLPVGGQLAVRLPGNPTTGYTWEVQALDASILQQLGEPGYQSDQPQLVGSGGTLTLAFKALKPGTTRLLLVYRRPFEANVAPLKTFSVMVTVK